MHVLLIHGVAVNFEAYPLRYTLDTLPGKGIDVEAASLVFPVGVPGRVPGSVILTIQIDHRSVIHITALDDSLSDVLDVWTFGDHKTTGL